jgi:uncharacterized membrane protein HdeD (DUF308 family)
MTQTLRPDASDVLGRVGRHWGWMMAFGIITVAAGIVALAWPGPTLLVIAIVFGIELVVLGIFRFVAAFGHDLPAGTRFLYALLGLFSLVIGLYALRHVLLTVVALGLLLGIFWVIHGFVELFGAVEHREMRHRGWSAEHLRGHHPARLSRAVGGSPGGHRGHLAAGVRLHGDRHGGPGPLARAPRRGDCGDAPGTRHLSRPGAAGYYPGL